MPKKDKRYIAFTSFMYVRIVPPNPIPNIECNLSPFVNKCCKSLILIQLMNSVLLEECLTHIRNYDKEWIKRNNYIM